MTRSVFLVGPDRSAWSKAVLCRARRKPQAGSGASAPPEWPGSPANSPDDTFKSASLIKGQSAADGLTDLLASDQLLGQAAPNTVYLGQRMMYEKEQQLEEFDPLRSTRFLWEFVRRAFLMWLVWAVGCIPIFIVGAILGVANHTFGSVIAVLLFLGWCFVMACVFWLSKLPGQLSEWKFSVDDRGQAAPGGLRPHRVGAATAENTDGLAAATTLQSDESGTARRAGDQAGHLPWLRLLLRKRW